MQARVVESDAKTEYIQDLEREFHKIQLQCTQQYRENFLKTEFILNNDAILDSYVDYLKKVASEGIENDYMGAKSIVQDQIDQYDVTDEEIQQFLASF